MKRTAGWLDPETGKMNPVGTLVLEAEDVYYIKLEFLNRKLGGTKYADFVVVDWLPLVRTKSLKDNRKKIRPPSDFLEALGLSKEA